MMHRFAFPLLALLRLVSCAPSQAKSLNLAGAKVEYLGFVNDPTSNSHGIFHDGGGGASQNGYHVQVFADSMTNSSGFNFVHNSVAYYGYVSLSFITDIRYA